MIFENRCSNCQPVRVVHAKIWKTYFSDFSRCRVILEICSYEFNEHFETGFMNFGDVMN